MRIPDTDKLKMGYSRGVVVGHNGGSRKDPDVCTSLQVRLLDVDLQPEIEVFAPLPKGKIIGACRASKSENPIGKEVHVSYKYNVGYQEYVYGTLISENEVENVKQMEEAYKAQDIQKENDRLQRAAEQRVYAQSLNRRPITKSLIIAKTGCIRQIIFGTIFGGVPFLMMIATMKSFIPFFISSIGNEGFGGVIALALGLAAFFLIFIICGIRIVSEAIKRINLINDERYSVVLDTVSSLSNVESHRSGSDHSTTYTYKFSFDNYTGRSGRTVSFTSSESRNIQPGDQYYLVVKNEDLIKKESDDGVLVALPAVKYCFE